MHINDNERRNIFEEVLRCRLTYNNMVWEMIRMDSCWAPVKPWSMRQEKYFCLHNVWINKFEMLVKYVVEFHTKWEGTTLVFYLWIIYPLLPCGRGFL